MAGTLLDWAEQAANTQNAYQQQKLNDLKLQEYQQDAPTRNMLKQAQAEDEYANAAMKKQKIIGGLASNVIGQLDKSGITDPTQRQQFITQAIDAHKPYLQNVLKLPVNDYLNEQQLRSLSQAAKGGEYHPPVQTSTGYLQYGQNGFEPMLDKQGKPYMPPVVDIGLRGRGRLAEELAQLYTSGGIDQPTYERLLSHAVSGQQDIQQPMPQAPQQQPRPQVHIDPTMSPEDQATAQQDWANYEQGVANQPAQGGGVPAPSGGIPSMAETERLKAGIAQKKEIDVANAKSDIELNQEQKKQKQQAQQELPAALLSASNDKKRINELLNHKGLSGVVGVPNALGMLPGTSENDFKALLKQVEGGTFLTAAKSLKGTGAMSEIEGAKAEQAVARLQTAQSENAFKEALKDYESSIDNLLEIKKAQAEGREPKLKLYAPSESQANQFIIEPINE